MHYNVQCCCETGQHVTEGQLAAAPADIGDSFLGSAFGLEGFGMEAVSGAGFEVIKNVLVLSVEC